MSRLSNGLVLYSDIHRCENGILGVCNIRVDNDLNVRGMDYVKLPSITVQESSLGIPMAKAKPKSDFPEILVDQCVGDMRLKLIMSIKSIEVRVNFDNVDPLHDPVIDKLQSSNQDIDLYICGSNLPNYDNLKVWLQIFIDLLDGTKPSLLGLLIEGLRYIVTLNDHLPTQEDIHILRMILYSYFIKVEEINQGAVGDLFRRKSSRKFKSKNSVINEFQYVIKITDEIVRNPTQPIVNLISLDPEHFIEILKLVDKLTVNGIISLSGI